MPTPSTRTPVRIARGSYSDLNGSISDIQEGEIVYAQDEDACYVKESSSLVKVKGDVADDSITEAKLNADNAPTNDYVLTAKSSASGGLTWAAASGGGGGGLSSDAQRNTVGGTNAGDSFTGTDATDNTLIGYDAGTDITTADKNSLYGSYSGDSLTTGSYNTCVGMEAGAALTTSSYGVYVGYEAGKTYSTENQFGASALCVGGQAGKNSTGVKNTFIGTKCGQSSGSGNTNCYMGNETAGTRTGNFNVGIGAAAFPTGGDGSSNCGLGFYVFGSLTSGSDNTAIGDNAGGLTTGSNCTILGHDAAASSNTVSNEITIGDTNVTKFRLPGLDGFQIDDNGTIDLPGAIDENVYECSGTELDPDLGTVQYKTLAANTTLTESLTAGQSMLLMVDDGTAYTVTWPTMTWVGGSAPTLATSGYTCIELWKIASTLYGCHVGDVA